MQTILLYILLAAAVFYIARRTYRAVTHKESTGCEHCGTSGIDVANHKRTATGK